MPAFSSTMQQLTGSRCSKSTRLPHLAHYLGSCSRFGSPTRLPGPPARSSGHRHSSRQQNQQRLVCCVPTTADAQEGLASVQVVEALREAPLAPPTPRYNPWQLVSRTALAGGVLEVVCWEPLAERCLRIWLPPGYSPIDARQQPYPVLYLNDGQNLFGDCPTISGSSWNAAHTAAELICSGKLPPFIIVGIDHAGADRSLEYTPCTPGTGPGGFRADAATWLGGGVQGYLQAVKSDIIPWVTSNYPVSCDPSGMAFGGSSFGGIAALVEAMQGAEGCAFGAVLIESPSLWIGQETFLQEVMDYQGPWPERIFIGMGGKEFSGTRNGEGSEHDANFLRYLAAVTTKLTHSGLGSNNLAWRFEPEAAHTESAWAARLPAALQFIAGSWWQQWEQRYSSSLSFTVPRRLKAGTAGQVLFFNKSNSHTLRDVHQRLKVTVGFNGWQETQQLQLQPVEQVQQIIWQGLPQQKQQLEEVWGQLSSEYLKQLKVSEQLLQPLTDANLPHIVCETPAVHSWSGEWYVAVLPPLPGDCYEVNFVFSDVEGKVYDNNAGNDYYLPVRQPAPLQEFKQMPRLPNEASSRPDSSGGVVAAAVAAVNAPTGLLPGSDVITETLTAAAFAASSPADEAAAAAASNFQLYFSMPPVPVAGAPATLYVNRAGLGAGLDQAPNVKLQIAFNDWQMGHQQVDLKPTSLWRSEGIDWWSARVDVPADAVLANFVFAADWNGAESWDNNDGHDYHLPVRSVLAAAAAAAAEAAMQSGDAAPAASMSRDNSDTTGSVGSSQSGSSSSSCRPASPRPASILPLGFTLREVESFESFPHAGGTLQILQLKKRNPPGGSTKGKQRWWDEKCIRVWLPPGFDAVAAPPGGWPALLMCDGQNMFEDWLAHQGVSWQLGLAAAGLISTGAIPPCVCIAIDSAGPYRSYNYLPFPPGTGQGGFRGDAARWPGGGAHDFLMRLEHELLPMLQQRYGLSQCPSRLAFGGGSFAGVTALLAAIVLPHRFGGILVESPSLWVGEGRFLQDLEGYTGRLPEKLSLGCGTCEYSATRDHERHDVDQLLLHQYHEAARLLQERGLRGDQRFRFIVDEGAGHHEGAWQWRLGGALRFLAQDWYDG